LAGCQDASLKNFDATYPRTKNKSCQCTRLWRRPGDAYLL
jgi:hypothetical protein